MTGIAWGKLHAILRKEIMCQRVYETEYAGHPVHFSFRYPETKRWFHGLLRWSEADTHDVLATEKEIESVRPLLPPDAEDAAVEFRVLIELTAKALLRYDCCIFHSVSFVWRGRTFLLTAPSGTGKTTQYLNWQRLFPSEITMICGDMPVLERREDGSVWAHPSSWNGKEKIGSRLCAPVAGIVLLEQGKENHIRPLSARDAVMPFFEQFVVRPDTEEQIRALARLMDQMLRNIPCFKFVNLGDDASTTLLRETLTSLAEGGEP